MIGTFGLSALAVLVLSAAFKAAAYTFEATDAWFNESVSGVGLRRNCGSVGAGACEKGRLVEADDGTFLVVGDEAFGISGRRDSIAKENG